MTYYEFFGLEPRLHLDLKDLEQRFYALSRKWHPDRFARATPAERQQSLDAAALLNDGYRTLRDPVARAQYLLDLHGIALGDQPLPPELLEEVFELNMELEEGHGDRARFTEMLEEIDSALQQAFQQWDATPGPERLETIRSLLHKRRYITNLLRDAGALTHGD
ncbi:MAG: Fe-S protein assembly co-chaperone HscB [Bryobacteraceae bacterium]